MKTHFTLPAKSASSALSASRLSPLMSMLSKISASVRRAAAWVQSVLGPARVKYLADRAAHAAPDHGGGFAAGWRGYVLGVPDLEAVNAVYWEARLAAKFQGDLRTALEEAAVDGLI